MYITRAPSVTVVNGTSPLVIFDNIPSCVGMSIPSVLVHLKFSAIISCKYVVVLLIVIVISTNPKSANDPLSCSIVNVIFPPIIFDCDSNP